jgi:hypothetical protein
MKVIDEKSGNPTSAATGSRSNQRAGNIARGPCVESQPRPIRRPPGRRGANQSVSRANA